MDQDDRLTKALYVEVISFEEERWRKRTPAMLLFQIQTSKSKLLYGCLLQQVSAGYTEDKHDERFILDCRGRYSAIVSHWPRQ